MDTEKMHSKDFLAQELRKAGLNEMADRAETGWYHDFLSPLDTPAITLADDLTVAANQNPERTAIIALRNRHLDGEFDATQEESDDWANSPEGQKTLGHLLKK